MADGNLTPVVALVGAPHVSADEPETLAASARLPDEFGAECADAILRLVRQSQGALSVWCAAVRSCEEIDRHATSTLQVTAAAIAEALCEAEQHDKKGALKSLDLMRAGHLVGLIDSALWNFVVEEIKVAPSVDSLVSTAQLAHDRLDNFLAVHGFELERVASQMEEVRHG